MADELFTVTYWEVLGAQVIHSAAGAAAAVLAAHGFGLIGSVPWYGVLSAAGIAALTTLLLALAGKANPNSGPATLFIPTPTVVKAAKAARLVVKAPPAAKAKRPPTQK